MEDLRKKEDELFERWKIESDYKSFIKDGVFKPDQWKVEPYKITFILKEANWEGGNVDLKEWLLSEESQTYWKTWNNVVRWTKAILEGGEYPKYISKADKTFWLSKISFINLKKVGGDSVAENNTIREYAIRDSKLILEQLNIYKPDFIVCCGRGNGKNADLLYEEILTDKSSWQEPIDGFNYFYTQFKGKEKTTPVISFYHPQRIASHQTYENWYNSMKKIASILV